MINTNLPGHESANGGAKVHTGVNTGTKGLNKLVSTEKVAMISDNTTCEKILQCLFHPFICCCRRKYKIMNAAPGYKVGDTTLYRLVQTSICCPTQWTLYYGDTDEGVMAYTYRDSCFASLCRPCCGGPGLDLNDLREDGSRGTHYGDAFFPKCQCFDRGYDIRDTETKRKYYVGYICNCCGDDLQPLPVWNEDKNEITSYNILVVPCLKRFFPCLCCCMKNHWIIDFPHKSNDIERANFIGGNIFSDKIYN